MQSLIHPIMSINHHLLLTLAFPMHDLVSSLSIHPMLSIFAHIIHRKFVMFLTYFPLHISLLYQHTTDLWYYKIFPSVSPNISQIIFLSSILRLPIFPPNIHKYINRYFNLQSISAYDQGTIVYDTNPDIKLLID